MSGTERRLRGKGRRKRLQRERRERFPTAYPRDRRPVEELGGSWNTLSPHRRPYSQSVALKSFVGVLFENETGPHNRVRVEFAEDARGIIRRTYVVRERVEGPAFTGRLRKMPGQREVALRAAKLTLAELREEKGYRAWWISYLEGVTPGSCAACGLTWPTLRLARACCS